jgi:hypothetical protein
VAEDYWTGRWDQALREADELISDTESGARHYLESDARIRRGRIRLARDEKLAALTEDRPFR